VERSFQQVLLTAAVLVAMSLLGAPQWAVIVALIPAMFIAKLALPDDHARNRPLRDRLPSPARAVLMVVVVGVAGALGAAGLMDSWPGVAIWAGVLGVTVVAGRFALRRWEQPGTA